MTFCTKMKFFAAHRKQFSNCKSNRHMVDNSRKFILQRVQQLIWPSSICFHESFVTDKHVFITRQWMAKSVSPR